MFEASYDDALEWVQMQSGHLASQPPPQEDVVALQQQITELKVTIVDMLYITTTILCRHFLLTY